MGIHCPGAPNAIVILDHGVSKFCGAVLFLGALRAPQFIPRPTANSGKNPAKGGDDYRWDDGEHSRTLWPAWLKAGVQYEHDKAEQPHDELM